MIEALRDSVRFAGPRAFNGAPLRWTPGPDELRLPFEEDEPVPQNTRQVVAIADCFYGLRLHWRGRRNVFVGADQFIHWDRNYHWRRNPANPPQSPDVYVAFGVADRHRPSYVVWEEGKPPDFVLEVVSPSSRKRDEREKPVLYAKMGVPEFFLYDPAGKPAPTLFGYALRGGKYRPLPTQRLGQDAVGVASEVLGLALCLKAAGPEPLDGRLHFFDPGAGTFLPLPHELADEKRRLTDANHRLAGQAAGGGPGG